MIPSNDFRQRVLARENLCGTHVCLNEPAITEIFARTGFDFIWIDTEHTAIDYHDLLLHLGSARQTGKPALVRVAQHDPNHVKRVLEMGPDGIIFPMINTVGDAEAAMKSCLYPPRGTRGFGPLRAVNYGADDLDTYIRSVPETLCRFIQIETADAVKNLPKIVANPYIDGYIFGPCDLSGSIGELNNVFGDKTIGLIKETIAILRGARKCIGISTGTTSPRELAFWYDLGINMISSGADFAYLRQGAQNNLKNIRDVFARENALIL